ncbi:MAG TPA: archaellar assembly protein FlaJ [Candidatus Thermoplasmatota archaeon]|nr:archaellar assembly protein FlaJ [Candidatus Thermoplasmatota archaeon]
MAMDVKKAYASVGMPPATYLLKYAVPLVITGVAVSLIFTFLVPDLATGVFGALIWAIPLFFLILAVIYPYLVAEGRKQQIDRNIHFFITHMGVLATSNIPRSEIMRILGEKKEYGALAEETRKIYALVDAWNMSLAEACRFISKRCPSDIFSDFLDRFAYAMESGEELGKFLKNEQIVVMDDYSNLYEGHLYEVESMKEMFNSLMMSVVFIVIFAILMPVITGIDAIVLMGGALFLVLFIEVAFVYFTKAKAPTDPMWHQAKVETALNLRIKRTLPVSLAACLVVLILGLNFTPFPVAVILAMGLTPLLYTGFGVAQEEEKLKRRDDNFGAFIRSLGASTSARGGNVKEVLRTLRYHDFGPLTQNIQDLYQRLNLRVDDEQAWEYFAADTGSMLIEKFTRMFVEGVKAGGKPDEIGRIISDNFVRILGLRKSRYQTASSFRGVLYGLMAGMSFALFVGVAIVGLLEKIFTNLNLDSGTPFASFFNFSTDLNLIAFLVIAMLLVHSVVSSLMIRIADGGNYFRSYVDLVGLFWVAAIVSWGAQKMLTGLLSFG